MASDAIKSNKVKLNDVVIKPAHLVKVGERYTLSFPQCVKKIVEVTGLIDKRQSYEVALKNYIDHSPPIDKIQTLDDVFFNVNIKRDRGAGRPTKKDKRDMTDFGWE
jgi:ribosome-associated heat shock protein Hsp15